MEKNNLKFDSAYFVLFFSFSMEGSISFGLKTACAKEMRIKIEEN